MQKKNSAIIIIASTILLVPALWSGPIGDLDSNNIVNIADLAAFAEQWLEPTGCTGHPDDCADLNGQDGVNWADFALFAENWQKNGASAIIINEIHYNPDVKTERVEFVELYNNGSHDVNISGWHFCSGVKYTFPAETTITAKGFIVITEDPNIALSPTTITGKYGTDRSIVYGAFVGGLGNEGEKIELCDANGVRIDQVNYKLGFPWPTTGDAVPEATAGTGHSIQLIDSKLDNNLAGHWRSAFPTPGAGNSAVYTENIPPCIRQVAHEPERPVSGEVVTVTAKVTDSNQVTSVTLHYQLVSPGSYIPRKFPDGTPPGYTSNPAYEDPANWTNLLMRDDGFGGDEFANDNTYSVQIPAGLQTNRRLVRYRITAEDTEAQSVRVPYADDPQPNFAYFVYDGVPGWTGNGVTYGTDVLTSLPVYHLISRHSDVKNCQWESSYNNNDYRFYGTWVYDGDVYDHIRYRIRGQASTFRWGKNKWKYNFNRGHYFQAKDDYGKKFKAKWNKMNVGTGACPWWASQHPAPSRYYWDKGTGGMLLNESMGFRLYRMAGVPAPKTHYYHFRVIDDVQETGATQYDSDFWGLYFGFEHLDGSFINEHNLSDGNIYKMDNTPGKVNQGKSQVTDNSDVNGFTDSITGYNKINPVQPQSWWETNVNLDGYYSFKSVGIAINNSDPRPQANCVYYHNPDTNQWSIHPWDLDLTYEWSTHYTDWEHIKYCLEHEDIAIANKNRTRELLDLLFNNNHFGWRQTDQLVNEMAAIISVDFDGKRFIDAEQALWENHPRMASRYSNLWYGNNEYFNLPGKSKNWDNMTAYYKKFLTPVGMSDFLAGSYGVHTLINEAQDSNIPLTPTVTFTGTAGFPENDLTFQCSSFNDPQGAGTFAAMKWRIAEVNIIEGSGDTGGLGKYEIEAAWESEEITSFDNTIRIPADGVKAGHAYRVRCKMKDSTGRWSHWSDPNQFVASEAINADILDYLRVTEVMYNNGNADFIELKNVSTTKTLDLSDVSISSGVDFSFDGSNVATLTAGDFVLVVKDTNAFKLRYGAGLNSKIAGTFVDSSLSNSGEIIKVEDFWNGTIIEFEYNDGRGWPIAADGAGHSIVPLELAIENQPMGTLDYGANWRQSAYIGGSPGIENPAASATTVVINEFMAHTDYFVPPHESNDWVELYNTSTLTVNLNGNWYLSDDGDNLKKYALPASALSGGGYVRYDQINHFNPDGTGPAGWGLNKAGDKIFLSYLPGTSENRVVDCVKFKGQENSVSLSRYPDGDDYWFHTNPNTPNGANQNPVNHLVISEIMYHPPEDTATATYNEYVELYNPTGTSIDLWTVTGPWALDGGVDYTFPEYTTLNSHNRVIIVGFDPADSVRLAAFESAYGTAALTAGVDIFGPWSGNLSNNGERLTLEKPQDSDDPLHPEDISWIIVDECTYNDYQPWPTGPDGTGKSLKRKSSNADASGNDPANWKENNANPGS